MTVDELLKGKQELAKARKVLADFYRAPLSIASVQPVLALAVELNPELKETGGWRMPEPRQPLETENK